MWRFDVLAVLGGFRIITTRLPQSAVYWDLYNRLSQGEQDGFGIEHARKIGHCDAIVAVQLDEQHQQPARLQHMTPDRSAASVGAFVVVMPAQGSRPQQVELAAIDTSPAYQKGAREHLPQAQNVSRGAAF